jgi:cyclopropane fatty-acyl-phospholipid synthase-like methyltransferase
VGELVDPALLNGRGASTQWMNLGWWGETNTAGLTYATAAAELARQVGLAARLRAGDRVLDVGCGASDSTALWVRAFDAAHVTGIEPNPAVAARATHRVASWGLRDHVVIASQTAEACTDPAVLSAVTAIVSVDAAYHFDTRAQWLQRMGAMSAPGVRLGLFDIALRDAQDRPRFVSHAHRAGIPTDNLWSVDEVAPTLEAAGFTDVRVRPCSAEVFAGFIRFVRRNAPRLAMHPSQGGWRALATALMLAGAGERLTAVLIGAERNAAGARA